VGDVDKSSLLKHAYYRIQVHAYVNVALLTN